MDIEWAKDGKTGELFIVQARPETVCSRKTSPVFELFRIKGDEGRVYEGAVAFAREVIDPKALPSTEVPVMLNVGNPENAFVLGQLPSAGVGLTRSSRSCSTASRSARTISPS